MRVASLHIHPVKSARAVDVAEARLLPSGLEGDRRWMIVDDTGRFLTQREEPRLALLHAAPTATGLALCAPGLAPLALDFPDATAPHVTVHIWRSHAAARVAEAASAWLTGWLGRPLRLVWLPEGANRPHNTAFAKGPGGVGFQDGYPVLIANTASLADLNARLDAAAPMNRFRANIVIESDEPWGEDAWARLRIGETELELVKPCDRCVVTTIDQATGERATPDRAGHEPLRTLQRVRKSADARVKGALFGWNAVPVAPGIIRVGDPVEVLSRRAEPWPVRAAV